MRSFQDLKVWQKGMSLVDEVYKLARTFPEAEFEIEDSVGNRLKRAAVAIPAKIANGYSRGSRAGYLSQLRIARNSLRELEDMLDAAEARQMATKEQTTASRRVSREVGRQLGRAILMLSGAVSRN